MSFSWEFSLIDILSSLAIVLVIVAIAVIKYWLKKFRTPKGLDTKFISEQWKKIETLLDYGKEMNYKLAVIEADKLLDFVLKALYFPGETMGERLKVATYKFPKLREVWWAHKARNCAVHEARYILKYNETKKILGLYKNALRELNAL